MSASTNPAAVGRARSIRPDVVRLLGERAGTGATWADVADALGVHHGRASGALSFLHEDGAVARLRTTRNGSKVYVLPGHVEGRLTEPYGRSVVPTDAQVEAFREAWLRADAEGRTGERVRAGLTAALRTR